MSVFDWLGEKLGFREPGQASSLPHGWGMPVGTLLGTLTAYVPRERSDGWLPEDTPVKVQRRVPSQPDVYDEFDLAYISYERNREIIVLTLRENA